MAGSGTTLAVARRLGRNYVGIEEQGKFVEIINERLARPLQQELF
jgi:DNA modification methylase